MYNTAIVHAGPKCSKTFIVPPKSVRSPHLVSQPKESQQSVSHAQEQLMIQIPFATNSHEKTKDFTCFMLTILIPIQWNFCLPEIDLPFASEAPFPIQNLTIGKKLFSASTSTEEFQNVKCVSGLQW